MAYKIIVDYYDEMGKGTYGWEEYYGNLCQMIKYAKDELNQTQCDVKRTYVVDTDNGLTLWSSDDSPEYESALLRHSIGSNIQSEKPSVYFDIDGVLGKWYADARGYSSIEEIIDPRNHYFRDIEPHPAAIELAKRLYEQGADVCIISSADVNTIRDKWEWIDEHLPFIKKENIFFSPLGASKADYIKGNSECSVLIDDYNENLNDWKGFAIKAINTVNSHQGKYPEFDIAAAETAKKEVANTYIDNESFAIVNKLTYLEPQQQTLGSNQIVDYINALVTNKNDYYNKRFKPSFTQEERFNFLIEESAVTSALSAVKYTVANASSKDLYTLSAIKGLIEKCKVDCYSEEAREANPERYAVFVKAMDYISKKISDVYKEKACEKSEPNLHSPAKKVSEEFERC